MVEKRERNYGQNCHCHGGCDNVRRPILAQAPDLHGLWGPIAQDVQQIGPVAAADLESEGLAGDDERHAPEAGRSFSRGNENAPEPLDGCIPGFPLGRDRTVTRLGPP